ncbi:flagellar hook-length control protein FliK [Pacificibacter marinus]|uniref:Flagellar hook-length control protein FliK n=1 Tax=Pacificibacter marinus TaxID=658057 RepID=A0A1Y5SY50_9RHOB|nr:flagellar hook-length control protein FliK [Pacificibacter marinus]SEL05794.1 hook-length control protein FliK [Pacificibacter marinus]SLN51325.1 Flagellar hook-length control protein FliK [Pacificibacter marinus]
MQILNLQQSSGAVSGAQIEEPTQVPNGTSESFSVSRNFQTYVDSTQRTEGGANLSATLFEGQTDYGLGEILTEAIVSNTHIVDEAPQLHPDVSPDISSSPLDVLEKVVLGTDLVSAQFSTSKGETKTTNAKRPEAPYKETVGVKDGTQSESVESGDLSTGSIVPLVVAHPMIIAPPLVTLSKVVTDIASKQNQLPDNMIAPSIDFGIKSNVDISSELNLPASSLPVAFGADGVALAENQATLGKPDIVIAPTPDAKNLDVVRLVGAGLVENTNTRAQSQGYAASALGVQRGHLALPVSESVKGTTQQIVSEAMVLSAMVIPAGRYSDNGLTESRIDASQNISLPGQTSMAPKTMSIQASRNEQQSLSQSNVEDQLVVSKDTQVDSPVAPVTTTPHSGTSVDTNSTPTISERSMAPYSGVFEGNVQPFEVDSSMKTQSLETVPLYGGGAGISTQLDQISQSDQLTQSTRVELPARLAAQIADVARQLPDGPIEISLSPEELGKVRLTFQISEAGVMNVVVAAERPDTLEFMRRNLDSLLAEFSDLGYEGASFQFQQDSQNASQDNTDRSEKFGSGESENGAEITKAAEKVAQPSHLARLNLDGPTGLDLKM